MITITITTTNSLFRQISCCISLEKNDNFRKIIISVDSVLEIPLKRMLALRCCHVTTYSENKLLLESFLEHISEWMRDECRCNDTDIINERYNNISSKYK